MILSAAAPARSPRVAGWLIVAGAPLLALALGACPDDDGAQPDAAVTGCGNGLLEAGEECDGADLGGATCVTAGLKGGTLRCTAECRLDLFACEGCGNGLVEADESCDGSSLGGRTCLSETGLSSGEVRCLPFCQLDTSACHDCGNGVIEAQEDCDGSDLGSLTCLDLGFTSGELACRGCVLNTDDCCDCEAGYYCCAGLCCADGNACCDGICTDVQTDFEACGDCESPCNPVLTDSCRAGTCTCLGNAPCAAGLECCGSGCKNVTSDPYNCGACGQACRPSEVCENGTCRCGDVTCVGNESCCADQCADLSADPDNCGFCGRSCGDDTALCEDGQCLCGAVFCTYGQICCGGQCTNHLTEDQNCGTCGHACPENASCSNGLCDCAGEVCVEGLQGQAATCCGASGCVTWDATDLMQTMFGVSNCGACGVSCDVMVACVAGQCEGG